MILQMLLIIYRNKPDSLSLRPIDHKRILFFVHRRYYPVVPHRINSKKSRTKGLIMDWFPVISRIFFPFFSLVQERGYILMVFRTDFVGWACKRGNTRIYDFF